MFKVGVLLWITLLPFGAQAQIDIDNAWLRAPIPGQSNTVGYLQLHNTGAKHRQLVAVESQFSKRAELHTQQLTEGMMQMRKLEKIDIAAHDSVELVSGGHHIMFLQLNEPLESRESWPITLVFSNGERISVDLAVRTLSDLAPHTHTHHQH